MMEQGDQVRVLYGPNAGLVGTIQSVIDHLDTHMYFVSLSESDAFWLFDQDLEKVLDPECDV